MILASSSNNTKKRIDQISSCEQVHLNNGSKLCVYVDIRDSDWNFFVTDAKSWCLRAAEASFALAGDKRKESEASILLANDEFVQALNVRYRGVDQPTNVLAFAASDSLTFNIEGAPMQLGDIIIARETVLVESMQQSKKITNHLSHLIIHGMLHLMGFGHNNHREALRMEKLETNILATLGIDNPYESRLTKTEL